MGIESLSQMELIHGIFTTLLVVTFLIIGLRIIIKSYLYKTKVLFLAGLGWTLLSSAWWGSSFSFISIILTGKPLSDLAFLFIANAFIPLSILFWIITFTKLIKINKEKLLILIYAVLCVLFEIFLLISLIINPAWVGTIKETYYSQPALIVMLYQIFVLLTVIITGLIFSQQSLRSKDRKIHLKGKFLLFAFILLTIGGSADAILSLDPITLIVVRLILILSSILFYIGFLLPERIANLILGENIEKEGSELREIK